MTISYEILRWAHLLAGFTAFFVAPVVLGLRKGSAWHRKLGLIYFFPMSFAAGTAAFLAAARGNTPFIFIGLFSLYLGISGYRALRFKPDYQASGFDRAFAGAAIAAFLGMLIYGGTQITRSLGTGIPLLAFGTVGLILAIGDWRRLGAERRPSAWLFGHMSGMVSSYIAAVSAFSVINFTALPLPVRILWPAAIGIPALLVWRAVWRKRIAGGKLQRWAEIGQPN